MTYSGVISLYVINLNCRTKALIGRTIAIKIAIEEYTVTVRNYMYVGSCKNLVQKGECITLLASVVV